jgi:phosphoglycolate phosphatase-like HAD superfamily hydrolase
VLFAIDGTLITTGGAGAVAWRLAFEKLHGIPADIGRFSDAGVTDPEVGRLTFTQVIGRDPTCDELDRLMAKRLEFLPQVIAEAPSYRVLPGVETLLPELVAAGYLVGLTTGGTEPAARVKLARADLNKYFSFGGYGSDSPDRAELTARGVERAGAIHGRALDRHECLVVGDTPLDIEAAQAAGATAVGVASGKFTVQQLSEAGADHVLASLEEELPL